MEEKEFYISEIWPGSSFKSFKSFIDLPNPLLGYTP